MTTTTTETRATGWLALSTIAWLASLALARFGPEGLWSNPVLSWLAVALNLAVGVLWIVVFTRFLRALDDLQRKIMQDALAITLGVGWIGGFGYLVAQLAGLLPPLDVALFPVALGATFLLSFAIGKLRYR